MLYLWMKSDCKFVFNTKYQSYNVIAPVADMQIKSLKILHSLYNFKSMMQG